MTSELPLIGRESELARVQDAIVNRRPLLIVGSRGTGKSRLIEVACLGELAAVRIECPPHPHELLAQIARALVKNQHRTFISALRCAPAALGRETSLHLRGILRSALASEPCPLILENVHAASAAMYRFLQPLFYTPGISMIVTVTSRQHLGFLNRLFRDPRECLELKPLRGSDARRLAVLAAEQFDLPPEIDRADLQEKVLEAAAGNPGRIIGMYQLAADSRYHSGDYVKMGLIQIDLAARFTA